jgi:hypothetical protein
MRNQGMASSSTPVWNRVGEGDLEGRVEGEKEEGFDLLDWTLDFFGESYALVARLYKVDFDVNLAGSIANAERKSVRMAMSQRNSNPEAGYQDTR